MSKNDIKLLNVKCGDLLTYYKHVMMVIGIRKAIALDPSSVTIIFLENSKIVDVTFLDENWYLSYYGYRKIND